MNPILWILFAAVAGRMLQLYLVYLQSMTFNAEVKRLRTAGTVSVGLGGKRYRGGRAFVAIAIDPKADVVRDAISLQGFTTFAKAKPVRALSGVRLNKLGGDREIPGLTRPQRLAAAQAVELYRKGRENAARKEASEAIA
jgi:DNA-binding transcriptional regulator of glucitol operon